MNSSKRSTSSDAQIDPQCPRLVEWNKSHGKNPSVRTCFKYSFFDFFHALEYPGSSFLTFKRLFFLSFQKIPNFPTFPSFNGQVKVSSPCVSLAYHHSTLMRFQQKKSLNIQIQIQPAKKRYTHFASVWYKIRLLWGIITYLKSSGMLLLKYCANIYGLRLLIELLYITIVQGAAKLWHFKIGDLKKNQTFWVWGYILFGKSDSAWLDLDQGNSTILDL